MIKFGALLIVMGIGAFVLPLIGMQFSMLQQAGDKLPYIAGGAIAVGLLLCFLGRAKGE